MQLASRPAEADPAHPDLDISLVVPCLNEVNTLGAVIEKGLRAVRELGLHGEVLVSDNGSTDGSIELARKLGARVVHATARGYGNALRYGVAHARGRMIVMGDADDTYDFSQIGPFVERMRAGAALVMGTRLGPGRIQPGANPWLNRYLGTPVLTFVLNRLFGTRIHDANCGMRGFTRESFLKLGLRSSGMELASEMVIKAALNGLRIDEVPVTLYPDRRGRPTHLRRWRDGWRHLEFMLLHAPDQLLFIPGTIVLVLGLLLALPVSLGPQTLFHRTFDFHVLFYGGALALVGLQGVLGAILAHDLVGGVVMRRNRVAVAMARWLNFGRGLAIGGLLFASGAVLELIVLGIWYLRDFGLLNEPRRSVSGLLMMSAGAEVMLFSFLHAVLKRHVGGGVS